MAGLGPGSDGDLGNDYALIPDPVIKAGVFLRVNYVDTAALHRDRSGGEAALVRGGVNAPGQA